MGRPMGAKTVLDAALVYTYIQGNMRVSVNTSDNSDYPFALLLAWQQPTDNDLHFCFAENVRLGPRLVG